MTEQSSLSGREQAIVDQSDDVRDPADDSDELNDPTAMADTYPKALEDKLQAAEAIEEHRDEPDRRTMSGNGDDRKDEAAGLTGWAGLP
ncbi:hypothetical protein [Nakamurella endophytica]|uniref:Uncharacterized protein n=1 Tax=Nakamurella endophytica TaxID=1748367 RepID=A0A917WF47_9ACTN|nr:hypothetical protein [Nakamurella endophytica]GGL99008.1 hypothetical protein GCM10011594_18730 [Nakamurella endophytica]